MPEILAFTAKIGFPLISPLTGTFLAMGGRCVNAIVSPRKPGYAAKE
jgi:hypothetical protein